MIFRQGHLFAIYLLILLAGQHICAQPIYFQHYQVEDGLANNTVFAIFQDSRGFLWMGTKEGLNRFDGTAFKDFGMKLDEQSYIKEFVFSIEEGFRQTLWVGTRKGLCEFDPRLEKFRLIAATKDKEVLMIVSDKEGRIWYIADSKLYCYDERTAVNHLYSGRKEQMATVALDNRGNIWAASTTGLLFRYQTDKDDFECVNCTSADLSNRPHRVNRIFITSSGEVLIGSIYGLTAYHPKTGHYRPILGQAVNGEAVYVRDILALTEDTYWIASESGIYSVRLSSGDHFLMRQQDSDPYSLSDNAVYALFKDYEGGVWCGSYFGGVNYYHHKHAYFHKYFRTYDHRSLSGNAIRELCPDGFGNLWVGTEDAGLNRMHLQTGQIERIPSPSAVSSTNVHALLVDNNELWVGTFQHGLDVLDVRTGRRKRHYSADATGNGLRSNFILSSLRTDSGALLFGTSQGVHRYRKDQDRFELLAGFPAGIYVFCLYEDADGLLWAGTIGNGLYFYDPRTGERGNFRAESNVENSLSSNSVCGLFEDSSGDLWISTEGGGLCRLDSKRKFFTRFDTGVGLPSNMVYKVLEDDMQTVWVSTSRGLARYDRARDEWKTYTKAHGLLTDQFNYSSAYKAPTGTQYFGSVKGLISFNPNQLNDQTVSPPVYITNFQIHNQDVPIGDAQLPVAISFADTIRLRHDQSTFSIAFAALSFMSSAMTPYMYRMVGVDRDWTYLASNRQVYFTGLAPGDYAFRVRTVAGGTGSERTLHIHVAPPWWLSMEAYTLYALGIVLGIYLSIITYHKRQKERHKRKLILFEQAKEREIYKAKIEFFTHVAHEIRTPLTLIKGPLEVVMEETGEQRTLHKYLKNIERNTDRLVHLTDQLLDFRRMENEEISLSFVKTNISRHLEEICQPFSALAETKNLTMSIDLPTKDIIAFVDQEAFHKILDNLIGNALKYAKAQIWIRLWKLKDTKRDKCCIEVSNDGRIIPWAMRTKIFEPFFRLNASEQSGSGIGLSLALSLTELHHGTLILKKGQDDHNTFLLTLPQQQSIGFKLKTLSKKDG